MRFPRDVIVADLFAGDILSATLSWTTFNTDVDFYVGLLSDNAYDTFNAKVARTSLSHPEVLSNWNVSESGLYYFYARIFSGDPDTNPHFEVRVNGTLIKN